MYQKYYLTILIITSLIVAKDSSRSGHHNYPHHGHTKQEVTRLFQEFCVNQLNNSTIIKCSQEFNKIYVFDKEKLTIREAQLTCRKKFNNLPFSSVVTFSNCDEYNLVKNFLLFVTENNADLWQDDVKVTVGNFPTVSRPGDGLPVVVKRDTVTSPQETSNEDNLFNLTRRNKKNPRVDVWTGGYSLPNDFDGQQEWQRHDHPWDRFIPGGGHEHDGHGYGRDWNKDCEDDDASETLEAELISSEVILTEHHMVNVSSKFNPWQDQKRRYTLCQLTIPENMSDLWELMVTPTSVSPTTATEVTSSTTETISSSTTTTTTSPTVPSTVATPVPQTTTLPRRKTHRPRRPVTTTTVVPLTEPTTTHTTTTRPPLPIKHVNRTKDYFLSSCQDVQCPQGSFGKLYKCKDREYNMCANSIFGQITDQITNRTINIVDTAKHLVRNMTHMKNLTGGDILSFINCAKKISDQVFEYNSSSSASFEPHRNFGHSVHHVIGTSRSLIRGFSAILDQKDAWDHIPKDQRTESAASVIERIHEMSVKIGCRTSEPEDTNYNGRDDWHDYEDYYRSKYDHNYRNKHKDHPSYHYDHVHDEAMKMAVINGSNIQMETFNLENGTITSNFVFPKLTPINNKTNDDDDANDQFESRRSKVKFTNNVPVEKAKCGVHVASGIIYQKITDHLKDDLISNDDELSINTNLVSFSIRDSSTETVKLPNETKIMITLAHHDLINFGDTVDCVFWNFNTSSWSGQGCIKIVELSFRNQTVCQCDHLTNFAALLDISNRESNDDVKNILTIVCSTISVICLTITILLFSFVTSLRNRRSVITTNLSICLLCLNVLVMAGFDQTDHTVLCRVISGVAMYSLLSAFSWMLMEGYFLYQMVIIVFRGVGQINTLWLYIFGYGPPLVIVVTYVAITGFEGLYEPDFSYFCWISSRHEPYHIWAVAGPGFVVIFINLVILIVSFRAAIISNRNKPNSITSRSTIVPSAADDVKEKRDKKLKEVLRWFKGWTSLMVLVGLTWIVGLLYIHEWTTPEPEAVSNVTGSDDDDYEWLSRNRGSSTFTTAMSYLFIILNASQGTFIFLFEIILNGKSRKQLIKLLQGKIPSAIKYLPSLSKTNSSQSNGSNQTSNSRATRSTASTTSGQSHVSGLHHDVVRVTPDPSPSAPTELNHRKLV